MQPSLSSPRTSAIARCDGFFAARIADAAGSGSSLDCSRAIHDAMLSSVFTSSGSVVPARVPAIASDGTPIVYSLKVGGAPEFRMVVEPGSLLLGVPEQIGVAFDVAELAADLLGWRGALRELHRLLGHLVPNDLTNTKSWWGGVWTGFAVRPSGIDLRLYVNVRNGSVDERWDRLRELFTDDGGPGAAVEFRGIERAVREAGGAPAGVCAVLAAGRFAGLRLYTTLHDPVVDAILACIPPTLRSAAEEVERFAASFEAEIGVFPLESVSTAFDFMRGDRLDPRVVRFKAELSCQLMPEQTRDDVWPWFTAMVADARFPPEAVVQFREDLIDAFGGAVVQYASIGIRERLDHYTLYTQPLSLATIIRKENE